MAGRCGVGGSGGRQVVWGVRCVWWCVARGEGKGGRHAVGVGRRGSAVVARVPRAVGSAAGEAYGEGGIWRYAATAAHTRGAHNTVVRARRASPRRQRLSAQMQARAAASPAACAHSTHTPHAATRYKHARQKQRKQRQKAAKQQHVHKGKVRAQKGKARCKPATAAKARA